MFDFRKADENDVFAIWEILQQAIRRRKEDGSLQWQNGYPNLETVKNDIERQIGFVLIENEEVIAYSALIFNDEPAYEKITGEWLTNGDFLVVHRVAVSDKYVGKGMATKFFKIFEDYALQNDIFSIKVDTNFDNAPMLKILEKLGYIFCGLVYLSGGERKAFEKILK
jgi:GNAT superfamily N-acetyltransferase